MTFTIPNRPTNPDSKGNDPSISVVVVVSMQSNGWAGIIDLALTVLISSGFFQAGKKDWLGCWSEIA